MVRSAKAYHLFGGWRGGQPAEMNSLQEVLLRVSAMVENLPETGELDLNQVKVLEVDSGYVVIDARVMLF